MLRELVGRFDGILPWLGPVPMADILRPITVCNMSDDSFCRYWDRFVQSWRDSLEKGGSPIFGTLLLLILFVGSVAFGPLVIQSMDTLLWTPSPSIKTVAGVVKIIGNGPMDSNSSFDRVSVVRRTDCASCSGTQSTIRISPVGSWVDENRLVKAAFITCLSTFQCSVHTCSKRGEISKESLAKCAGLGQCHHIGGYQRCGSDMEATVGQDTTQDLIVPSPLNDELACCRHPSVVE